MSADIGLMVACPYETCAKPAGTPCRVENGKPVLHATRVFFARRAARQAAGARAKFTKGQRVQLTDAGKAVHPHAQGDTGTVVGFGREPHVVAVVRDGQRSRSAWHMDFWEALPAEHELDTAAQLDLSVDLDNPQEG